MITRSQIVTKNRKVLWPVTWQSGYKKADFWSSNQFAFLWTENSFFGLPCLEFVILWSKTGSACAWSGGRLRLWGTRGISLTKGASHFIVQETSTGSSSRRNSFSSDYKRLVRERCCPFTAQIWLVQIGRPLPDWYGQKADALLSLAVIFPETPSRGRTAQCSRPTQSKALVVCSMKHRSDSGALFLWTTTMVRERSSVSLRYISHSENKTLLLFNVKGQTLCKCFGTEPLCGNKLRNMSERKIQKKTWLKECVETQITIQTQSTAELCTLFDCDNWIRKVL